MHYQVSWRLETCIDLAAADAVYHRHCLRLFYKGRPADAIGIIIIIIIMKYECDLGGIRSK